MEYHKNLSLEDLFYFNEDGIIRCEEWRDVPGYEGKYHVSDLGRVKALEDNRFSNINNSYSTFKPRIMKSSPEGKGYLQLWVSKDGKPKCFKIHKLVAIVFLQHTPSGYKEIIDHKNNIRTDNRAVNLQKTTSRHNVSKDATGFSTYTGVVWDKQYNKWRAQININKQCVFLGLFLCEKEAGAHYSLALENIPQYDGNRPNFRERIKLLQKKATQLRVAF